MGAVVSNSMMDDRYVAVCGKLKVLYDPLKEEVLACSYVQVNESTVPVINNEMNRTRKGFIWCVRDVLGGAVFFHYDLGPLSTRRALTLLMDFRGASRVTTTGSTHTSTACKGRRCSAAERTRGASSWNPLEKTSGWRRRRSCTSATRTVPRRWRGSPGRARRSSSSSGG